MSNIFQGFWGLGCTNLCTCVNGGKCDQVTGECMCPAGLSGDNCEEGCPPGINYEIFSK